MVEARVLEVAPVDRPVHDLEAPQARRRGLDQELAVRVDRDREADYRRVRFGQFRGGGVIDRQQNARAAQDVDVNVLANDIEVTQLAEIGLMRQMLAGS